MLTKRNDQILRKFAKTNPYGFDYKEIKKVFMVGSVKQQQKDLNAFQKWNEQVENDRKQKPPLKNPPELSNNKKTE